MIVIAYVGGVQQASIQVHQGRNTHTIYENSFSQSLEYVHDIYNLL